MAFFELLQFAYFQIQLETHFEHDYFHLIDHSALEMEYSQHHDFSLQMAPANAEAESDWAYVFFDIY